MRVRSCVRHDCGFECTSVENKKRMPFVKGRVKTGGRPKGGPNAITRTVQETLARLGCDPFDGMATIAQNKLPCGVCRGKGKTPYKLPTGEGEPIKIGIRTCESCYGTLFEACSPELRGKMHAELAQYVSPKRKALDITNSDGSLSQAAILRERYAKRTGQ